MDDLNVHIQGHSMVNYEPTKGYETILVNFGLSRMSKSALQIFNMFSFVFTLKKMIEYMNDSVLLRMTTLLFHVSLQVKNFLDKNRDTLRSDVMELLIQSKNEVRFTLSQTFQTFFYDSCI